MTLPWARVALAALAVAAAGGCAKPQARTPATAPPVSLNVPAPPPRHVVPVSLEPIETPPPAVEPPPAAASAKPPATPPVSKPPDRTAPPPPTPPATDTPPPVLQTTRNPAELEAIATRDLARAKGLLARVAVDALSPEARSQYNIAERSIKLADDALRKKDFQTAVQNADKALTIAQALVKSASR